MAEPNQEKPELPANGEEFVMFLLRDTDQPLRFSHHRIPGDVDLRFGRVRRPLDLHDCEFTGKVDVRNAHFQGTVSLKRCRFRQGLNGGDHTLSHTICDQDLVLEECTFEGLAWFIGLRCAGSGYFRDCRFEGARPTAKEQKARELFATDFTGASFGKLFWIGGSVFQSGATFNSMHCESAGFFHGVRFESADQQDEINFVAAKFDISCELDGAVFKSGAIFEGLSCGWRLSLDRARFERPHSEIGLSYLETAHLSLRGAIFRGNASFVGLHCRNDAWFQSSQWRLKVAPAAVLKPGPLTTELRDQLAALSLSVPEGATLLEQDPFWWILPPKGQAEFWLMRLPDDETTTLLSTLPTRFEKEANFSHGRYEGNLDLQSVTFRGPTSFNSVHCDGSGFFRGARFEQAGKKGDKQADAKADFGLCSFDRDLSFEEVDCTGPLDLQFAAVKGSLRLRGYKGESPQASKFLRGGINLTGAHLGRLTVQFPSPFDGRDKEAFWQAQSDLREARSDRTVDPDPRQSQFDRCRITEFDFLATHQDEPKTDAPPMTRPAWAVLTCAQANAAFSRDLYLALERYYRATGRLQEADRVYFDGHAEERRRAGEKGVVPHWTAMDWVRDTIACYVTGYGVYASRAVWFILPVFILGTVIFSWEGNLLPSKPPAEAEATPTDLLGRVGLGLRYSLHRLVPVIDLHLADKWEAAAGWPRWYNVLHILAGWILVPLFLATFTGLLKRPGKGE